MPPFGWYYRLSSFFKERFGEKVYKIPLHAGLTCPNRDGTISRGGCIFCYNPGFSPTAGIDNAPGDAAPIKEQIIRYQARLEKGAKAGHNRHSGDNAGSEPFPKRKYLAYFQSYSNSYAPLLTLRRMYEESLKMPGIIGISVATRPDCLSPEVLDLLSGYASQGYHVWLELGLQSSHHRTLRLINRGHTFEQFEEAVEASCHRGISLCAHIINGLPGENRLEMIETARRLNCLPLNGIKFHQLQVLKGTPLAALYARGQVRPLQMQEYLEIVTDQLEVLNRSVVVQRLLSEVIDSNLLLAPVWEISRAQFSRAVEQELRERRSFQGIKLF